MKGTPGRGQFATDTAHSCWTILYRLTLFAPILHHPILPYPIPFSPTLHHPAPLHSGCIPTTGAASYPESSLHDWCSILS
eukprot:scaffold283351_cov30-Tisochrysis_lutea.AAC.1